MEGRARQIAPLISYHDGIHAIDTHYVRPRLAAVHLVVQDGRAALIDAGTSHSVPQVLEALATLGLAPAAVAWLLLTHVHLDHAGGARQLMQALPNARAVLHPRGAPHLVNPAKLVEASIAVYGRENFTTLYGEIVAIDAARVHVTRDGERIALAGREFEVLHTPGHALHHQAFVDHGGAQGANVFPGDTLGICYPEFTVQGRAMVIPTTTPTQFDPEQLVASIRRVCACAPHAAFLTHFGRVDDVARLGVDLERLVLRFAAIARAQIGAPQDAARAAIRGAMRDCLLAEVRSHGCALSSADAAALLEADIDLNTDGLLAWLARAK